MIIVMLRTMCIFAAVLALTPSGGLARAAENPVPTTRTWLWVSPHEPEPARHLQLEVSANPGGLSADRATFSCDIRSDIGFRGAEIYLILRNEEGEIVSEGMRRLDILAGANTCDIVLETSALPLGTYTARFLVEHKQLLNEPAHELLLRKVNADSLLAELEQQAQKLDGIAASLDEIDRSGAPSPYLRLKMNIARDVLGQARESARNEAWEALDRQLRYIEDRMDSVRAGLVFGGTRPEYMTPIPTPSLDKLTIIDGGFAVDSAPVFLFGGVLPDFDAESLALLRRYHLNAATIDLAPDENPSVEDNRFPEIRQLLDAAVNYNIGVAVQLTPDRLPAETLAENPQLAMLDSINIGRPAARDQFEPFIHRVSPLLENQPMLFGVSLANDPRFHFSGDDVKQGFIDFVETVYPDRLTLNRAWHSHLGTLQDITPWSENPYDTYQKDRPYQFDWQTYHQSLGNAYFEWSRRVVRSELPAVPLMVTLPNTFVGGETRYGVNRERLANTLQISGCSARVSATDPVYAVDFPQPQVYYNLLKSFQPGQPVFNLYNEFDFDADMSGDDIFRFVHSAVWEGVMAGLAGATVPMDSLLFERPDALEAFATAALDINRLAPIVHAFQTAPADVGILFSYASKVFDDGEPHLESASNAYEGAVFGGYKLRFVSEEQCVNGALDRLKILVLPDTPALSDAAFEEIVAFVERGGTVARTGAPIPYDERGFSRGDLIRNTGNTVLVRGLNLPTEYLHAMDAATVLGALPQIPRPITGQGYPVEGVKSQYLEYAGESYLYLINLRKEAVSCSLATPTDRGRDLIRGLDVTFPALLEPLEPMLLRLEPVPLEMTVTVAAEPAE